MKRTMALLVLAAAGTVWGAGNVRLRFTRNIDLPEAGLAFQLPAGAVPDPVPPPKIVTGQRTRDGAAPEKIEAQDPLEVWRWKQREGRWADERGNRLSLVTPSLLPPGFGSEWMPVGELDRAMKALETPTRGWGAPDLARWLEAFWGVSGLKAEPPSRSRPFALSDVLLFRTPLPGAYGVAVVFKLTADPGRWRVALIEVGPGMDAAGAEQAVREDFVPSLKPLARRTREAALAPGPSAAATNSLAASRLRARESIRNMKGWWCVEGENTIVLSNIRSGKSQLVDAILEDLETLRPLWERRVAPWEKDRAAAVVRVFGTEEEYVRYVGPDHAWSGGLWMADRKELAIRPVEEGSLSRRRQAVLATVYHEAFHQYLDGAFGQVQAAPWFNEGYACLFAAVRLSGKRVAFETDPNAAGLLRGMVKQDRADPDRILALDYPAFYAQDDVARREHYALAWGLLYFLEADEDNRKADAFRAVPGRYREALLASRDPAGATAAAFEGVDRAALKKAFQDYWK